MAAIAFIGGLERKKDAGVADLWYGMTFSNHPVHLERRETRLYHDENGHCQRFAKPLSARGRMD
jgi:hypothetical protein